MKHHEYIIENFFKEPPHTIAVAVSGGPDSMYLCKILHLFAAKHNVQLLGLIIDHKLRDESSFEALTVKAYLESQGIETHILEWKHAGINSNIHDTARNARYKILTEFCEANAIQHLCLGHTLNDQAETILMRIFRGSGVDGLCGIKEKSMKNGISIIRPLLKTLKSDIVEHLDDSGWFYVEDPSNHNTKFDRVKVREMLSQISYLYSPAQAEDIYNRFALLSDNCSRSKSYITQRVNYFTKKYVKCDSTYNFVLIDRKITKLHDEIKLRIFSKILRKISGKQYPPRLKSLLNLMQSIDSQDVQTLWNCEIHSTKDGILIFPEINDCLIDVKANENTHWCNYQIHTPHAGYKVGFLNAAGWLEAKNAEVARPKLPLHKVLMAQIAIYDADGKLIYAPSINFNKKNIEISITML